VFEPRKTIVQPKTIAQYDAATATELSVLFSGPWGCGKTHIGAAKAYLLGTAYSNNKIALVRKKRVDLKATLWKKFVDEILPEKYVVSKNDTELYRKLTNGTEFYGVGLDSVGDVNKLASREYGLVVVEEAIEITEQDFDVKILRCLRLPTVPFHQVMLLTNPGAPSHFLYKRFYEQKLDGYKLIEGTILPDLPGSYLQRLKQLRGIFRERYFLGKWTAFEGLVYPFEPKKHIVKPFRIPDDWRYVVSVDFGFDHPFVCQFWAISPSDVWYLVKEIYMTGRTVRRHAEMIKETWEKLRPERRLPRLICDHDAEDTATLKEAKFTTRKATKDRLAGQQAVYTKFENDQIFFFADSLVEKDQRLEMEERPTRTIEEFPSYLWRDKGKEDMVKEKDDGMDSMRYAIYTDKKRGTQIGRIF